MPESAKQTLTLLSKDHPITEKGMLEFQPFGKGPDGRTIHDLSGIVVKAAVEHLEDVVTREHGREAGRQAVEEHVRRLNSRIPDPAFHVTVDFLKNPWNGYSNEFSAFNGQFTLDISGDPRFNFNMGRDKAISPIIQVLGRPFSVPQIYKMSAYFSQRYGKDSFLVEAVDVADQSAVLRMTFTERMCRQFGRYRRACGFLWCDAVRGYFTGVPEQFHDLPPAIVEDRRCIAEGDEYCEWVVTWSAKRRRAWPVVGWLSATRRARVEEEQPPVDVRPSPALPRELRYPGAGTACLSNEHRITEKGMMEFQPFGTEPDGTKIRDISGVVVVALVEHLEETMADRHGGDAGRRAVEELVERVNERIPDRAYRVTASSLKNRWNSYSNEFGVFLTQFCWDISGDPQFSFNMGRKKAISTVIQVLGRPFSVPQIYKMSAYFAQRFAKDSFYTEALQVSDRAAIIQMRFSDRALRQFGPYVRACAEMYCMAHKGYFAGVPEMFHRLPAATVVDRSCIARGDAYCEWEIAWSSTAASLRDEERDAVATRDSSGRHAASDAREPAQTARTRSADARPELLSKYHPITEKAVLEWTPFGVADGKSIRDVSGVTIRACVEYLQDYVGRTKGPDEAKAAVDELSRRLSVAMPDRTYEVTPAFLTNTWNAYSFECAAFISRLCSDISADPDFQFNMARERAISPFVQVIGRPFSVPRIYKMSPYFAQIYSGRDGYEVEAVSVREHVALLRMRFGDRALRQFGRHFRSCALDWCNAHKGYFVAVPEKFHQLPAARIADRACMAEGDSYCEWEVTWRTKDRSRRPRSVLAAVARKILRDEIEERERLIDEQVRTLDTRHVELQEAYVQQQQSTAELQRRVDHLTTLHDAGLGFASILDRDPLIDAVLRTVTDKLHYDRALLMFYDRDRGVARDARIVGVAKEIADFVRAAEVPVEDRPGSVEAQVLLRGEPFTSDDIQQELHRLHAVNQQLARRVQARSVVSVPLKLKNKVMGSLTVDRGRDHSLTQDDVAVMMTLASQIAVALDNTEAYRQIEQLNAGLEAKVGERTAELERADRHRSLFLSHVSHELRTPLTSIKGFLDNMFAGVVGTLNDRQEAYLRRVAVNADRLIRMIGDLLDQTRIESGRLELSLAEYDLEKIVGEAIDQLRPLAAVKRLGLAFLRPEAPVFVSADSDRVMQIVTNLIHNAIKFTPDEGDICVGVVVDDPQFAGVFVKDTGVGIPDEAIEHVFDPFFRVGAQPRTGQKGIGLGLSIVKTLVELHGGTIRAHSKVGRGTEFYFTVPLSRRTKQAPAAVGAGKKHLLVVDDDPDIRQMLTDRLTAAGYTVFAANGGEAALQRYAAEVFDGVVLDIGMPDIDGLEVLKRIRQQNGSVPIVMVTASGSKAKAVKALSIGAQDYLLKPFEAQELDAMVARWFGEPGPTEPSRDATQGPA